VRQRRWCARDGSVSVAVALNFAGLVFQLTSTLNRIHSFTTSLRSVLELQSGLAFPNQVESKLLESAHHVFMSIDRVDDCVQDCVDEYVACDDSVWSFLLYLAECFECFYCRLKSLVHVFVLSSGGVSYAGHTSIII
jgi:hypothetical protein